MLVYFASKPHAQRSWCNRLLNLEPPAPGSGNLPGLRPPWSGGDANLVAECTQ
ncbi:hypothetical protein AVEN_36121-1, partial [Araneus ventricosus]